MICAPLAMTMTHPPVKETDSSAEKPVKSDKTVWSVLRNPLFLCVGVSQAVANIGMSIMFTYLPDVAVLRGFPKAKSNFLLSIVGESFNPFISHPPFVSRDTTKEKVNKFKNLVFKRPDLDDKWSILMSCSHSHKTGGFPASQQ